jgi:hypothetical protein
MEIPCPGKECKIVDNTLFCGPKQGNFNASNKEVLDYIPEKLKQGLPITTDTVETKALEVAKSLKTQ